ncbi:hypothetical protein CEXT_198101 [Caerostris extrusa]|uniref:Uncharacterized protein n=1 Tax=Caerostris extrusa TaxID=172846 RepID=A0AAV4N8W9_CAEEX|nr:hypothetical protein CEXT_198101 [Caerostris extrusa]
MSHPSRCCSWEKTLQLKRTKIKEQKNKTNKRSSEMKIRQLFELRGVLFSSPLQQILAPNGVRKTGNENNYHPGISPLPQQTSHSRTVSLFLNGIGKVIISLSVIASRG